MFGIPDGSQSNGYVKRGTKPGRRTDFMADPEVNARRQKALARLAAQLSERPAPDTADVSKGADFDKGRIGDVLALLAEIPVRRPPYPSQEADHAATS